MSEQATNDLENRNQLIVERNVLFNRFLRNPLEIGLALEIKVLDDRVAECNERIRKKNRNAEPSATNCASLHENSSGN